MGIFYNNCREKNRDDEIDLVEPISEEIQFPTYYSKCDSILESLNETNLLKYITLIEYINLLANITPENANNIFEGPYKMNFSYYDSQSFINSIVSDELYDDFITKRILSHRIMGESETIFKDICTEIYEILKNKIKEHYQNENAKLSKKNFISLGIFFCKGTNAFKMKLIFDLFKNAKGDLEQNKIFDEFLLSNFLIASYCLILVRKNLSRNNPLVSEISFDKIDKYMEIYNLKNCEDLVEDFNFNFFNGMKLTFYEYKLKFKDNNGFWWIFSPEGIRQKLEENKFLE